MPMLASTRCRLLPVLLLAASCRPVAEAQNPLKTLPNNYKLMFENDRVAVIRAHYGPHETVAVHDHPSVATVFVYLNDAGPVRINHQEEGSSPETVVRPPTVAGAYRVATGLAERHSIENPGDTPSDFLRVELKGVALGIKEPFRGKAPARSLKDEDVVEFNDPAVRVERIVCVDAAPCLVKDEGAGSLVVALTPLGVAGATVETLAVGGVLWVAPGQNARIGGGGVRHVLRVLLPGAAR